MTDAPKTETPRPTVRRFTSRIPVALAVQLDELAVAYVRSRSYLAAKAITEYVTRWKRESASAASVASSVTDATEHGS